LEVIDVKFLDSEQKKQIGFDYIMDNLQVITPYGEEIKRHLKHYKRDEVTKLNKEYDWMESILAAMQKKPLEFKEVGRILGKTKDIRNSISRCKNNEVLDDIELFEIKYFTILVNDLISVSLKINLGIKEIELKKADNILELLDPEGQNIPTFCIYDGYSDKLKNIRHEKKSIEKEILIENDKIKFEELKEKRLNIVISEDEEEFQVRKMLSGKLLSLVDILEYDIKIIGKIDFLIAKIKLAQRFGAIRPMLTEKKEIRLKGMINPEIESILNEKNKAFTPLDIELNMGTAILTGANMGGKSVALKTITLNVMLGSMGFFVFAKEAQIYLPDFIYFISDDMQSITKGLSTFGAEIIKLKEVLESIKTSDGFVVLDEFARGTNPGEGLYLVRSLCKYLNNFSSISLISTHYDGVVQENMVHYQVVGLKNVDFEKLKLQIDLNKKRSVEIIQEHMEYRLERVTGDSEVPKDALNICMLLGLEEDIIAIARQEYNYER
jgi:DNA mismatch repair protein MutS2